MSIPTRNAFAALLTAALPLTSALAQTAHDGHHVQAVQQVQAPAPDASTHAAADATTRQQMSGHAGMDHEAMMQMHQRHMGSMEHGSPSPGSNSAMDHGAMDHAQAGHSHHGSANGDSMRHDGANHDAMYPSEHATPHPPASGIPPGEASRPPVPTLRPEDRSAAFPELPEHDMHRGSTHYLFAANKFEWQDADAGTTLAWDISGWVGGDIERLILRSEGERTQGHTEEAELQLLWSHAIGPWWETVAGVRQDFEPGTPQTWAAFGLQGTPLWGLETEATAFIGESGQSAVRLEAEYDLLLTQRWVLQPQAELNVYGRDDEHRGVGSGLSDATLGLRLRYEWSRQFAPYVGVEWNRGFGDTAEFRRDGGEPVDETRLVAGIRFWF